MQKVNFLWEIGTEEIPAGYIKNASECIQNSFIHHLNNYSLKFETMDIFSTPRRLALKITGLDESQQNEQKEKLGPVRKVAFDEEGNITKVGIGFLKGIGATEKDLLFINTPKGEYIGVNLFIKGKYTKELLPAIMKETCAKIVFPKTMKWGTESFLFARPIRWFVALLDETIIDFEFCGVRAGRRTSGIRFDGLDNSVDIVNPQEYPEILKKVKVYANREERKQLIKKQLAQLNFGNTFMGSAQVLEDNRLLDIVTDLVEFPTAVKATFDEKYLSLPAKIITSTLSQNQKYFSVVRTNEPSGSLLNEFVFISNGNPEHSEIIKIGNEKVVQARLADASFYFHEDIKHPLEYYVEKLSGVVFQTKLGTLLDKTNRLEKICGYLGKMINLNSEKTHLLLRSARLCKADLVTLMLGEKEFTKLQGYIGMNYALITGVQPEIAQAIYEHYMPRGQNDDLPSGITGALLAIADKMDTVCGIMGVGLIPTGSQDPFAIRRSANGIVQIIDQHQLNISLSNLISEALSILHQQIADLEINFNLINNYFKQRIKWLLEEHYHIEYDVLNALDIFAWENIIEIRNRALDLQRYKTHEDFKILVSGYKRVANILEKNKRENACSEYLLVETAEKELYAHLHKIKPEVETLVQSMAYTEVMDMIVPLGINIDAFFDQVLVMCDDQNLKINRLALLAEVKELFWTVADISKINYE